MKDVVELELLTHTEVIEKQKAGKTSVLIVNGGTEFYCSIDPRLAQNKLLVERSLAHVHEMKKNVLGESVPHTDTYNPRGQKAAAAAGARFVSKEA